MVALFNGCMEILTQPRFAADQNRTFAGLPITFA